jgi:hypothetical protein
MITVSITPLLDNARYICPCRLSSPYQSVVEHQKVGLHHQSKLKLLVPSIGTFFTRLPLAEAFRYQDRQRFISSRRFVPPSFNDIRLILNTAQIMGVTASGPLDLATFDGDVTLYDDGKSLEPQNEVISRIIRKCTLTCSIRFVEPCPSQEYYSHKNKFHPTDNAADGLYSSHEPQHQSRYCHSSRLYRSSTVL